MNRLIKLIAVLIVIALVLNRHAFAASPKKSSASIKPRSMPSNSLITPSTTHHHHHRQLGQRHGHQAPASSSPCSASSSSAAASSSQRYAQLASSILRSRGIRFDEATRVDLSKGQGIRLHFFIEQPSPLSVAISSCGGAKFVDHKLYFNQSILVPTGNSSAISISVPCAAIGRYDLMLTMPNKYHTDTCVVQVKVNRFNVHSNWSLLDLVEQSSVRFYNRLQRRQMIVKWDRCKLDMYAIHYCLVIGTTRNHPSLCAASRSSVDYDKRICTFGGINNVLSGSLQPVSINHQDPTVTCTAKKNRQILHNLRPHTKYFVDVFGVHTKLDGLAFRLATTSIWFNRTHPIVLHDDKLVTTKLSDLGRQTIFSFKVPKKANSNQTSLLILPCGNQVGVKVFRRKTLQTNEEVFKPTVIALDRSQHGDRYVIKVEPLEGFEIRQPPWIGIAATTSARFSGLPEMPNNTLVEEIISSQSCQSTWIAWHSSPDDRAIRYCVLLVQVTSEHDLSADYTSSNLCELDAQVTHQPNFHQMHCFLPSSPRSPIQRFELTQLTPGSLYSVHVMVQLDNTSLPYELLRISTNNNCYAITEDNQRVVGTTQLNVQELLDEESD